MKASLLWHLINHSFLLCKIILKVYFPDINLNLILMSNPNLHIELLELDDFEEANEDDESCSEESPQNKNSSPTVTVCSLEGSSY